MLAFSKDMQAAFYVYIETVQNLDLRGLPI